MYLPIYSLSNIHICIPILQGSDQAKPAASRSSGQKFHTAARSPNMHGSMYVKLQKRHRYRKRIYAIAHQTLIIVEIRPKTKKKKNPPLTLMQQSSLIARSHPPEETDENTGKTKTHSLDLLCGTGSTCFGRAGRCARTGCSGGRRATDNGGVVGLSESG